MFVQQRIIGITIGFIIFVTILALIRRKRLSEARAALWFIAGLLIFFISISSSLQVILGKVFGSSNMPATILALGALFLFAICLDLAVQVSFLNKRLHDVIQEFALLEQRVRSLSKTDEGIEL